LIEVELGMANLLGVSQVVALESSDVVAENQLALTKQKPLELFLSELQSVPDVIDCLYLLDELAETARACRCHRASAGREAVRRTPARTRAASFAPIYG
jgi:hypothetical protein